MDISTYLHITLVTLKAFVPGVPSTYTIDNAQENMNSYGYYSSMQVNLNHDGKQSLFPSAVLHVPEGLYDMKEVKLKSPPTQSGGHEQILVDLQTSVSKRYWSDCSVVPQGQPEITKHIPTRPAIAVKEATTISRPYFANASQQLKPESKSEGVYKLNTSFDRNTTFELSEKNRMLPPIELITPAERPDLGQAIILRWKPVEGALAYFVSGSANTETEKERVHTTWNSSSKPNINFAVVLEPQTIEQLEKRIQDGILMPANTTRCCIPAGIFKDAGEASLTIYAIGLGVIQRKDNVETRVAIRSEAAISLSQTTYEYAKQKETERSDPAVVQDAKETSVTAPDEQKKQNLPTAAAKNYWVLRLLTSSDPETKNSVSRALMIDLVSNNHKLQNTNPTCTVPNFIASGGIASMSKATPISFQPTKTKQIRKLLGLPTHASWYGCHWSTSLEEKSGAKISCVGDYGVTSEVCGNASFTLECSQDFLAPLEIKCITDTADTPGPILVEWQPLPEAIAYFVTATASRWQRAIFWSSSVEARKDQSVVLRPLSSDEVSSLIAQQVLLPKHTTQCTIPAGVFESADKAKITVTAVGLDKKIDLGGIETIVVVRSEASLAVKNKKEMTADVQAEQAEKAVDLKAEPERITR